MRILISGSTGFIGSYVTRLLSNDHTVAILIRPSSNAWRITDCIERVTRLFVDLENTTELNRLAANFQPDVVLHLAWDGVSNQSRNNQAQVRNVINAMNLLEAAIQAGAKAWIGLGSQAEYGPSDSTISEQTLTKPTSLYGAAKVATYYMAERRAAEAGLRFAWLRLFSAYGPSDHPDWMIPYLIQRLLKGEKPALTAGEQRWDYLFVNDAANAIRLIATNHDAEGIFNLGSGTSYPLRDIIETIRDTINPQLPLGFGEIPYRTDQVMYLEANVERLKKVVGWESTTSLAEGIASTINWYQTHGE